MLWQDKFETEIKLMEVPVNIFPNIKGLKRMLKKKKKIDGTKQTNFKQFTSIRQKNNTGMVMKKKGK